MNQLWIALVLFLAPAAGIHAGAPGYIPTDQCWKDGYHDSYCWVPPMTERLITEATARALRAPMVNAPEKPNGAGPR